jgi:hypothetical protein
MVHHNPKFLDSRRNRSLVSQIEKGAPAAATILKGHIVSGLSMARRTEG